MEDSNINVGKQTTLEAPEMFLTSFSKLFEFFQREILCDVVVQIGKKSVKCHRAVLASCSPYFEAMFTTPLREKEQSVITIRDIDENVLEIVIRFAYTAKVDLNTENAQSVLHASSILQIEPLAQLCGVFMSSQLNTTNCFAIRDLAHRFGRDDLVKKTDIFLKNNFLEISKEEEFNFIGAKQLEDIISDEYLFVESETEVYKALLKWIKHDIQNRRDVFIKLLSHVRLPFLPLDLIRSIEEETFICGKKFSMDPGTGSPPWFFANNKKSKPRKSYAGAIFVIVGCRKGDFAVSSQLFSLYHNKWIKVPAIPSGRFCFGCTSTEGKVYVFGGYNEKFQPLSTGEVYDPKTNQWSALAPMSIPRTGLEICAAEGAIYAMGGINRNVSFVERYDILSNVWSTVSPMNCERRSLAVVELNGIVYALGGDDGYGALNTCEAYYAQLDKWLPLPPMNEARTLAAAVALNGYIYVIGGKQENESITSVERYDLRKMQWTSVTPMSVKRFNAGAAVLGGCIYVIGGSTEEGDYSQTVEIYDPEDDVWTFGPHILDGMIGVTWCNIGAKDLKNLVDLASKD